MSLVERALKKMQQQTLRVAGEQPARASKNVVYGTVVHAGGHRGAPAADVTAAARVPSRIVEINETALRAAGLLPPEHQERQLAQQYRQIKRPLIDNAIGRGVPRVPGGHLIMMASALPGEGKTFTAINLAFSMSLEKDISVLLVDADLPKPQLSRLLGIDAEPGLIDVLLDESLDVESLILPTSVPGLSVLPMGRRADHATELLASERMQQIMQEIGRRNPSRITILDSPPLLLTTESHALAQVAGQVVIVVRAGVTSQSVVLDALSHLSEGKCAALILNQSVATSPSSYYYGYGDQHQQQQRKQDEA
jgi:protein-tyrosine kinase